MLGLADHLCSLVVQHPCDILFCRGFPIKDGIDHQKRSPCFIQVRLDDHNRCWRSPCQMQRAIPERLSAQDAYIWLDWLSIPQQDAGRGNRNPADELGQVVESTPSTSVGSVEGPAGQDRAFFPAFARTVSAFFSSLFFLSSRVDR